MRIESEEIEDIILQSNTIIENAIIKSNNECADQIEIAIKDSYKRLLEPAISNETLQEAKEKADQKAIEIFSENLRQLLLDSPLGEKRILAIDPGFKSGCKVVCLDEKGDLLHNETIYPHAPQSRKLSGQILKLITVNFPLFIFKFSNFQIFKFSNLQIRIIYGFKRFKLQRQR